MLKLYWVLKSIKGEIDVIAERFNIWAFLFTIFWALANRLWMISAILFVLQIIFGLIIQKFCSYSVIQVVNLLIMITCGIYATSWKILYYMKQGYKIVDVVYAGNKLEANLKFFDNQKKYLVGNNKDE